LCRTQQRKKEIAWGLGTESFQIPGIMKAGLYFIPEVLDYVGPGVSSSETYRDGHNLDFEGKGKKG
jgi:hypothetical protein